MQSREVAKPALIGMGIAATLALALAGCGNQTADKDTAIVVAPPSEVSAAKGPSSAKVGAPSGSEASSTTSTSAAAPAASSAPAGKAEGWGTLKGKVVYGGDPPPVKVLEEVGKAEKDRDICAKTTPIVSERLIVNPANKGVKNAFVYLQRPTAVNQEAKAAAAAAKPVFDQSNCTFLPHALAVMTNVPVTLKSSDPTNHNVAFQLKSIPLNPLIAPGTSQEVTAQTPERFPGQVSCSIHPWMLAYWMVLDHPYFAITDENGNYEIKNAPAGNQKLVVWQEAFQFVTPGSGEEVSVKAGDTTTKDFTLDPAKQKQGG